MKALRNINYGRIRDFEEPITKKRLFELSKKDLCRLIFYYNAIIAKSRAQYDEMTAKEASEGSENPYKVEEAKDEHGNGGDQP